LDFTSSVVQSKFRSVSDVFFPDLSRRVTKNVTSCDASKKWMTPTLAKNDRRSHVVMLNVEYRTDQLPNIYNPTGNGLVLAFFLL